MNTIYSKLQQARVMLQEEKLKKSGKNSFSGFKYFELMDFLPQVNKLFLELHLYSNFSIAEDMAILKIFDTENEQSGPEIFTLPVKEAEVKGCTPVQNLGAVNTYLKRYLYLNALEIVESDILDPIVGADLQQKKKNISNTPKTNESKDENDIAPDLDLILGVEDLSTIKGITEYFNLYQNKVKNKTAFIKAINAQRAKIQKETKIDDSANKS